MRRSGRRALRRGRTAAVLFDLWVGAGVRAKALDRVDPLDSALVVTAQLLGGPRRPTAPAAAEGLEAASAV